MEELVEFLQETLAKDFFFEDDFVIEQLQISMAELKRAKLDLPEPGKEDEFPKKPLGQLPPEGQSAGVAHLSNGQRSVGRSSPHPGGRRGSGSPLKTHDPSPPHPRRTGTPERARQQRRKSSDEEGKRLRDEAEAQAQRRFPPAAQDGSGQYNHAAANQNSNATSRARKEFAPRWHKPSEAAVLEKTAKSAVEGRSRAAPPALADPRAAHVRQKTKVLDAEEGKRGSTASQYDNVPEDGPGGAVEEALERARAQSPRRPSEPGASPSRAPPKFAFKVLPTSYAPHPFLPDGEDRGAAHPPLYSNPPTYQGSSPKRVPAANSSFPFPPGAHTNPSRRPYGSALPVSASPEKSHSRPTPLVQPSSRIEVLPADFGAGGYSGNSGSPKNGKFILPPGDGLPDNRKWSEVGYTWRPEMHGQPWTRDVNRGHLSSFPRHPTFHHTPYQDHTLPAVSVDGPVRYRTSPALEDATSPGFQYSGPSPPAYHYRNRDGLSIQESVLL